MRILKYGMSGPDVELLQLGMQRSGYYADNPDGIFGPRTQNALRRFQASFGLTPDGIAGEKTYAQLRPFLVGYFTTKIRPADTFYRLAKRYDTTINAIQQANPGLDSDNLQVGERIVIPYGFDLVPINVHYTSELMELLAEGIKARYPFTEVGSIGKSVMGRPLYSFIIGEGEREAFYNAAHHANEWITTPLVMKFMENYLKAYINNTNILGRNAAKLYENARLFLVPMVDPDGVDLVNNALDRNDTYYKEAKAISYEFTQKHDFSLILAYHTQGQVIYWKYQDIEPPRGYEIGTALAEASGYTLDLVPAESSFAGYKDWFILNYNRPGYTVEAGLGVNPLPLSQFGTMYRDNAALMVTALEETAKPE